MQYVESKENVRDFSSRHRYKDLKIKEFIYYVNFVADDATPNTLTIDITKKITKHSKTSNSGHAMNSGQKVTFQMWQPFLNYLPVADTSQ